jgi:peroxiredoxin
MGAHRTTFIVDDEGVVRESMGQVMTLNHPAHVLELLAARQKDRGAGS